jgi:competence protein ComEA
MKRVLFALGAFFAAISMSFAAVDVNKATAAELDSIKGIGPAISKKIVDERAKGQFKDWNDMVTRVNGIGEGNAKKLSEGGLTVSGAAFAGSPAKPAAAKDAAKPAAAAGAKDAPKAEKAADAKKDAKPAAADAKAAAPSAAAAAPVAAKADAKAEAKKAKEDAKAKAAEEKAAAKKAKEDAKAAAKAGKDAAKDKPAAAKDAKATDKKEEPKK